MTGGAHDSPALLGPIPHQRFLRMERDLVTPAQTDDERYAAVKNHPIAGPILEALHQQDANTYNGNSGDTPALAMATASLVEPFIRRDERQRLATLLETHAATLADFPKSPKAMLDTIVFLLRLDHGAQDGGQADG